MSAPKEKRDIKDSSGTSKLFRFSERFSTFLGKAFLSAWLERKGMRIQNSIAFYFSRIRELEKTESFLCFFDPQAQQVYTEEMRKIYEILYDRIMTAKISPFVKRDIESWFIFNKDYFDVLSMARLNNELKEILRRSNLL